MTEDWIKQVDKNSKFVECSNVILSQLFDAFVNSEGPLGDALTKHPTEIEYAQEKQNEFNVNAYKKALTEKRDLLKNIPDKPDTQFDESWIRDIFKKLKQQFTRTDNNFDEILSDSQIESIVNQAKKEWEEYIEELARLDQTYGTSDYHKQMKNTLSYLKEFDFVRENEGRVGNLEYSITPKGIELFKEHIEQKGNSLFISLASKYPMMSSVIILAGREMRGNMLWDAAKTVGGAAATAVIST